MNEPCNQCSIALFSFWATWKPRKEDDYKTCDTCNAVMCIDCAEKGLHACPSQQCSKCWEIHAPQTLCAQRNFRQLLNETFAQLERELCYPSGYISQCIENFGSPSFKDDT